ncbi:MAG: hypothetical protein NTV21_00090 [Planctomycetota bacterium]|nr:hypothetical protein [Planctomycetota bacterium]
MQRLALFLAALLALISGLGFARAQSSPADELAPARKQAVVDLEGFVEWTGTVKLYLERDRAWEAILAFAPEHEAAHKGLKHQKNRDGSWKVPEKRAESKNFGKEPQLEECAKRRGEIAAKYRAALEPVLEKHKPAPAARAELVAALLAIDPEDAASRALNGEAKRGEQWVLSESEKARERRGELKTLVKELVAAVPAPVEGTPRASENALGVTWTACVSTPLVRVLSSGDAAEARNVAIQCSAAVALFRKVTGAPSGAPGVVDMYLLTTPAARDAFVKAWPGWSDEERKLVSTWAGTGLPGEIHHARWDADAPRRLDGAVRHMLGLLTLANFSFDHQGCAWAWEGFGLYLTRELVGTHYTWYSTGPTSGDAETKELLGKLMMGDSNWMNEALQRFKRGRGTKVEELCARKIDAFGVDDLLTAYALAGYLLEGRSESVPAIYKALASDSRKALESALALTPTELDQRLLRWLSERK